MISAADYHRLYKAELLDEVIPFWTTHSIDRDHGGYYTCLLADGRVYDRDKFVWLQGRQLWTYSKLCNTIERRAEWLEVARIGRDFLYKHGRDSKGDWYFQLDEKGRPLVAPYNIFSDCFALMGFAEYYKITGDPEDAEIAAQTYKRILHRHTNPKGIYDKRNISIRRLKNFSLPMIIANLTREIAHVPGISIDSKISRHIIDEVLSFYSAADGLLLENVLVTGHTSDCFEGRLVNPGHSLEAIWFLLDLAEGSDKELEQNLLHLAITTLGFGWDEQYGGIYYFLDKKGYPPQQLEWNQKLWWVHLEAMICALKLYRKTGDDRIGQWFGRLHDYTWSHFRDNTNGGEWYGYLDRRGEVLLSLKGGKWKGCFHVPRSLWIMMREMEMLL